VHSTSFNADNLSNVTQACICVLTNLVPLRFKIVPQAFLVPSITVDVKIILAKLIVVTLWSRFLNKNNQEEDLHPLTKPFTAENVEIKLFVPEENALIVFSCALPSIVAH